MRLPRSVRFPFGYLIHVKLLNDKEMVEEADGNEGDIPEDGLFDAETRTIFIRKGLSIRRARYILAHEMAHAVADFTHTHLDDGVMKP